MLRIFFPLLLFANRADGHNCFGCCDAALQKHMQVQCAKGMEEVRKAKESGSGAPDAVALQHSNEVLSVHKACLTIAEEKVFLATQTYDLVSMVTCTALTYPCSVSICLVCGGLRYFHCHSVDSDVAIPVYTES